MNASVRLRVPAGYVVFILFGCSRAEIPFRLDRTAAPVSNGRLGRVTRALMWHFFDLAVVFKTVRPLSPQSFPGLSVRTNTCTH